MDDPILCITNLLPDFHGCTIRDTHSLTALGDNEPDPVRRARLREEHLEQCGGCLPRPAAVGYLCKPCAFKTDVAIHAFPHFANALAGIDRARQPEVASHSKPGSQLPIPPVPLAFDEIRSYEASRQGRPVDVWASTEHGAADAVRFYRAFRNAERAHPTEETSHDVKITRCPRCNHRTLVWHPPTRFLGEVQVACEYHDEGRACGYTVDQEKYEELAAIEAGTRPATPPGDRTLVFARRRSDAVAWAKQQDLRPGDWQYIGSANTLRGLNTGRQTRHFLDGFDTRPDHDAIRTALTISDLTRQDTAA